jgi:predicted RNase H-like HicB family nuclease
MGAVQPMNPKHYSMVIQWDSRDNIYVVTVPELPGCKTHGRTYTEAVKNALEVIELWIEDAQKSGETVLPPMVAA